MYAQIENGQVSNIGPLPKSWRNISGLHLATDEELKRWGWLPVVVTETVYAPGQTRDTDQINIEEDRVVIVHRVRPKTPEEITTDWRDLRTTRDHELHQSDWTQANDSPLSNVEKEEWAAWRRALRDLPSATAQPDNPVWPEKPGS